METASAPPPYTSTTGAHLLRFVAIWITGMGLLLLLLSSGQLVVWDDPGALLLALGMVGGGGGVWLTCRWRLDTLHRRNREYLHSERGIDALAGRAAFAATVRRWGWAVLAVFMLAGAMVIVAGSALGCEGARDGGCRLPEMDRSVFLTARAIAVVAGAAYVGLVVLGRSLHHETDRMDREIAQGQDRRMDGDVPGTRRSRWE